MMGIGAGSESSSIWFADPVIHEPVSVWHSPALIQPNNFLYKSLSEWAFNIAVGCSHACRFCYVPSAATIKQGPRLKLYGISDADQEWGSYVLLRQWDETKFLSSLRSAENTPAYKLKPDGNRAVIYCSTTDPYQVIHHPEPARQKELGAAARYLVTRSLELIRDRSTLNVRILTRSPLAKLDFDLFKSFGTRLLFGMSLPTMRNDLARIYEPKAPSPSKRFATLLAAKTAGLHVYVAIAPTYPECDREDLYRTLSAVSKLEPVTIFHEPINIRAENVTRIESTAASLGASIDTSVFSTKEKWIQYALNALQTVESLATELGIAKCLHLWPDKSLGGRNAKAIQHIRHSDDYGSWLARWWNRHSEWPGQLR
jgi:DNA repair photolyase